MRIWSLHPRYLDGRGLTACWREALLAQQVLLGRTVGYRHHPQLVRFRAHLNPAAAVAAYLEEVWAEAHRRGYRFDEAKIGLERAAGQITVTEGQVRYEWAHLRAKLERRSPGWLAGLGAVGLPAVHPLFIVGPGEVEAWEVGGAGYRGGP